MMEKSSKYYLGDRFQRRIDPGNGTYEIVEVRHVREKDGSRTVWYYLDRSIGRYLACSLEDEFAQILGGLDAA